MNLQERLEKYDPVKHGGEVMVFEPVGLENFDDLNTKTQRHEDTKNEF